MTQIHQQKNAAIRYGRILFNIGYTHLGSHHYQVSSGSPVFLETLGVKQFTFFAKQLPATFTGPEGNVTASEEQLHLIELIQLKILKNE